MLLVGWLSSSPLSSDSKSLASSPLSALSSEFSLLSLSSLSLSLSSLSLSSSSESLSSSSESLSSSSESLSSPSSDHYHLHHQIIIISIIRSLSSPSSEPLLFPLFPLFLPSPFPLSEAAKRKLVNDNGEEVIDNNIDSANAKKRENAFKLFINKSPKKIYLKFSKPLSFSIIVVFI